MKHWRAENLVKSPSSDTSRAVCESSAETDRFYLVSRRPAEDGRLPAWDELQSTRNPPHVAALLDGEAVVDWQDECSV